MRSLPLLEEPERVVGDGDDDQQEDEDAFRAHVRLILPNELVSRAMNREDVLGGVRRFLDLLPQLGDKVVDRARGGEFLVAPDLVEDLLAGHHLSGVLDEVAEQVELAGRELNALLAAPRLVQLEVDLDVPDADRVGGRLLRATAAQTDIPPARTSPTAATRSRRCARRATA